MIKMLLATTMLTATVQVADSFPMPNPMPIATSPTNPEWPPVPVQTNPQPFPPQPVQPTPQQPPIVVQAPPPVAIPKTDDSWISWILTALAGLFTTIFGIRTAGDFRKPKIGELDVGVIVSNPDFRRRVDEVLLRAIQTEIPGRLVGQIPGVGAFEPLIRRVATEVLESRIREHGGQPASQTPDSSAAIGRLIERLSERLSNLEQQKG